MGILFNTFLLSEHWRTVVHDILETSEHRAVFKDQAAFIEHMSENYLTFGDIRDVLDHLVLRSAIG